MCAHLAKSSISADLGRPVSPAVVFRLVACVAAFWLNVYQVNVLGLADAPPRWVVDAIPPVLSLQLYEHPVRYTSLISVRDQFYAGLAAHGREADGIDQTMAELATLPPSEVGTAYVLLGPDDKGMVDFVAIAFWLLGVQTRAITWLYLLILLASSSALLLATRAAPAVAAWLTGFLVAHALLMPSVAYNPQLGSYLALRAVPVLSIVACFHLLMFLMRPSSRLLDMTLVTLQVALIVFTLHLRSTTQWQVAVIALTTVAVWALQDRRTTVSALLCRYGLIGVPLGMLIFGQLCLGAYRAVYFPPEYQRGDQIVTRVFWHNIVAGLAFHPEFAVRQPIRIDDISTIKAVGRYLVQHGRAAEWIAMNGEAIQQVGIKRSLYDPAARDFLFYTCRTELDVCVSTAMYYKPLSLLGVLTWFSGLRETPPNLEQFVSLEYGDGVRRQMLALSARLHDQRAYAEPWKAGAMAGYATMALIFWLAPGRDVRAVWIATLALLAGTLSTTVIGYPSPWTVTETVVMTHVVLALAVSSVGVMVVRWYPRISRRSRQHVGR